MIVLIYYEILTSFLYHSIFIEFILSRLLESVKILRRSIQRSTRSRLASVKKLRSQRVRNGIPPPLTLDRTFHLSACKALPLLSILFYLPYYFTPTHYVNIKLHIITFNSYYLHYSFYFTLILINSIITSFNLSFDLFRIIFYFHLRV